MMDGDHLIWSNYNLNYEDWAAELEMAYPELNSEERYLKMLEINAAQLDDERANLSIQLNESILVIGSLSLWDGHHSGYREIASGNIRDCLTYYHDYATWYVDRLGDLRCDDVHHDGTNHYLYRVYKPNTTKAQRDRLKEKIYNGTVTRKDITHVTSRLGDDIGKVYGWQFPRKAASRGLER